MSIEIIDKPRGKSDYRVALALVERRLVKADFSDPELFLMLPTIREALVQLVNLYDKACELREAAEQRGEGER